MFSEIAQKALEHMGNVNLLQLTERLKANKLQLNDTKTKLMQYLNQGSRYDGSL